MSTYVRFTNFKKQSGFLAHPVYRVSFRRYRPLHVPNSSHFRACGRFWLSSVQWADWVADENLSPPTTVSGGLINFRLFTLNRLPPTVRVRYQSGASSSSSSSSSRRHSWSSVHVVSCTTRWQ